MEQNIENKPKLENKKVGSIEPERKTLNPAQVEIIAIQEETKKSDGTKMKIPLAKILCKHPEKPELINISKIKTLMKEKVIIRSLWVQFDADENIQKGSALHDFLDFMDVDCLADAYNKKIDTVVESDESPFLCLKAY